MVSLKKRSYLSGLNTFLIFMLLNVLYDKVNAQYDDGYDSGDYDDGGDESEYDDGGYDDSGEYDDGSTDTTSSYDNGVWTPDPTTTTDWEDTTTTNWWDTTTTTTTTTDTIEVTSTDTATPTITTSDLVNTATDIFVPTTAPQDIFASTDDSSILNTLTISSLTATTSSSTSTHEPQVDSKSTNTGAIIGGVVGGIAGVALLGALAFIFIRRHKAKSASDREVFHPRADDDDDYQQQPFQRPDTWNQSEISFPLPMSSTDINSPPPTLPLHTTARTPQNY
ncbi:MAG: hypothetical protein EXX96DRAFT_605676 [Benjaminiella poitrasii]|nr:MAG: hypothetical protein EXX96DRAFT_605676 [Benjaminiella poitrasii]